MNGRGVLTVHNILVLSEGLFLWTLAISFMAAENARTGGLAFDARAYYQAGQHLLASAPLYQHVAVNAAVAYRYPPIFAAFFVPFSLLPEIVFAWSWRLVCLVESSPFLTKSSDE